MKQIFTHTCLKFRTIIQTIGLALLLIPAAIGQQLNDAYLHAKADMKRGLYADAAQKIMAIPTADRTSAMYFSLGETCYLTEKYADAARFFAVADSLQPTPAAQLYAARAYAMMQLPVQAVSWLEAYLTHRDKLSESELTLDPAFAQIEHSREWKTVWNRDWYSTAERKAADAAVLIKRQKYMDALAIIDAEIARSPSARFHSLRAQAYMAMQQYEPAYGSAQTAIRIRNNQVDELADAATLSLHVKKYDAAVENINRAIRLDPYRIELYLHRATILRISSRYEDARRDLNFYLSYLPADTGALYQMGMIETDAGNPLAGVKYFSMLIDGDKTAPNYYIARANAGIKAGNYSLASTDLAQALDLNPALPDAWCKKGIVLQQENKPDDACYYWRKALELGSTEAAEYVYKYCTR